jgi:predicted AAA+ superfamily ATPase
MNKNEMIMESPFMYGVATFGKWFTDREEDAKRLSVNFTHGINTILISPRRWGKTSLVLKVAKQINDKNLKIVNLDIFSCRSKEDFYRTFAKEIIRQTYDKNLL